jgi:hypothetical protein
MSWRLIWKTLRLHPAVEASIVIGSIAEAMIELLQSRALRGRRKKKRGLRSLVAAIFGLERLPILSLARSGLPLRMFLRWMTSAPDRVQGV